MVGPVLLSSLLLGWICSYAIALRPPQGLRQHQAVSTTLPKPGLPARTIYVGTAETTLRPVLPDASRSRRQALLLWPRLLGGPREGNARGTASLLKRLRYPIYLGATPRRAGGSRSMACSAAVRTWDADGALAISALAVALLAARVQGSSGCLCDRGDRSDRTHRGKAGRPRRRLLLVTGGP